MPGLRFPTCTARCRGDSRAAHRVRAPRARAARARDGAGRARCAGGCSVRAIWTIRTRTSSTTASSNLRSRCACSSRSPVAASVRPNGAQLVESQKTVEQGRRRIAETGPHGFGVDEIALDEQTGEARGDAVGIEVELREHLRRFNPFTGLALGDRGYRRAHAPSPTPPTRARTPNPGYAQSGSPRRSSLNTPVFIIAIFADWRRRCTNRPSHFAGR